MQKLTSFTRPQLLYDGFEIASFPYSLGPFSGDLIAGSEYLQDYDQPPEQLAEIGRLFGLFTRNLGDKNFLSVQIGDRAYSPSVSALSGAPGRALAVTCYFEMQPARYQLYLLGVVSLDAQPSIPTDGPVVESEH
jgi:hypothetical protein